MNFVDIGLYTGYLLVILCTLAAIVLPLIQSLDNPKSLLKSAVGVVFLVVLFLISFSIADGSSDVENVSATTARAVSAGLNVTYIMLFMALGGIVYTEISKAIQ